MSQSRKAAASDHVMSAYDELVIASACWDLSMIHSLRQAILSCYFAIQEMPSGEDYTGTSLDHAGELDSPF